MRHRLWLFVLTLVVGLAPLIPAVPAAAQGEVQPQAAPQCIYHTVRPGEWVNQLAQRYGVSPQAIINANNLRPPSYIIYPGQVLCIPQGTPPPPPGQCQTYTVRPGDTLSSIAVRYGTTWQALAALNGIPSPYIIRPGQVLRVPPCNNPPPPPGQCRTYTVQRGDTLSSIAVRHGTTWQALAALNHIPPPYTIFPGQVLRVPPCNNPPPVTGITISSPTPGATVRSPVLVSGIGAASFENNLAIRVLDAGGRIVGSGSATVQANLGQPGPYSASIPFNIPAGVQNGLVQVLDLSAADGSVRNQASVNVRLQR
ncbi:MAG: LysM peptidoglycan-binding domain-containing protein [Anaerolineae bacterium]|nr:LysM peptidoglycan-binding domain-containing protein [Anaerolineae bacterium]